MDDPSNQNEVELKKYDYIRLCTPDLNGLHLSKLVSSRHAKKIIQGKCEMYAGMITFGPRMEVVDIPEIVEKKHVNNYMRPDFSTLHPCPWAGHQNRAEFRGQGETVPGQRVGAVLCDLHWPTGEPMQSHPRVMLKKLLYELENKHKLKLMSAFEPEFRAFKLYSMKPFSNTPDAMRNCISDEPVPFTAGDDMYKTCLLAVYESFFMTVDKYMFDAGIPIQEFSNENGAGQLECPLLPEYGIAAADHYFILKQALKEIGSRHGMGISFMTTPIRTVSSSGCHFNHSLWHIDSGRNAMYEKNDPSNLSQLARHWIGGLLEHLPAMLVLCSPTINCYRRLHKKLAPDAVNWDINDRFFAIRVKNADEERTYVENRIPSSASCPYHVMAATIAAGLDGIERKLEPPAPGQKPKPGSTGCKLLAHTLREALQCLKDDQPFVEKLGPYFVDWFCQTKERGDLISLPDLNEPGDDDLKLSNERYEYLKYI